MILAKQSLLNGKRTRNESTIRVTADEKLEYIQPQFKSERDRVKFIKTCEAVIRKSMEYKDLMKFLKTNMNMNECSVLKGLSNGDGKRYSIEIHHEPFTLFDIVDVVLSKRIDREEDLHPFSIADEVMGLHYDSHVGLIPLSTTMHEAIHCDRVFIPLQLIYQRYDEFFVKYEDFIDDRLRTKIEAKLELSAKHQNIASSITEVSFTYVDIDGFNFPEVPNEWKDALRLNSTDEQTN